MKTVRGNCWPPASLAGHHVTRGESLPVAHWAVCTRVLRRRGCGPAQAPRASCAHPTRHIIESAACAVHHEPKLRVSFNPLVEAGCGRLAVTDQQRHRRCYALLIVEGHVRSVDVLGDYRGE